MTRKTSPSSDQPGSPASGGDSKKLSVQAGPARRKKSALSPIIGPDVTLRDLAASSTDPVPVFVRKCVEFIEQQGGLNTEGLYRVPGNQV
jgi:hypothetical protein